MSSIYGLAFKSPQVFTVFLKPEPMFRLAAPHRFGCIALIAQADVTFFQVKAGLNDYIPGTKTPHLQDR